MSGSSASRSIYLVDRPFAGAERLDAAARSRAGRALCVVFLGLS